MCFRFMFRNYKSRAWRPSSRDLSVGVANDSVKLYLPCAYEKKTYGPHEDGLIWNLLSPETLEKRFRLQSSQYSTPLSATQPPYKRLIQYTSQLLSKTQQFKGRLHRHSFCRSSLHRITFPSYGRVVMLGINLLPIFGYR